MKTNQLASRLLLILCVALFFASSSMAQSSQAVLRYKDVVGTYRGESGSVITVDRAPKGMLLIHVEAVYPYRAGNGEMTANFGSAEGTTKLIGDTARFKPDGGETMAFDKCTITLVFKPQKLIVTQQGVDSECGFGRNVSADGTYRLTSRRVQKFVEGSPVKSAAKRRRRR